MTAVEWINASATTGVVLVTGVLAVKTHRMAVSTDSEATATRQMVEQTREQTAATRQMVEHAREQSKLEHAPLITVHGDPSITNHPQNQLWDKFRIGVRNIGNGPAFRVVADELRYDAVSRGDQSTPVSVVATGEVAVIELASADTNKRSVSDVSAITLRLRWTDRFGNKAGCRVKVNTVGAAHAEHEFFEGH